MNLKCSVVIPVYNDQTGLHSCLNALSNQDGLDPGEYEVIVVDNGSDPPLCLPQSLNFETQLLTCLKPGSYAARNAGILAANGEVIAFIDADCWPSPSWLYSGITAIGSARPHVNVGGEVILERSSTPTPVEIYQEIVGFGQQAKIEHRGYSTTANLFVWRTTFTTVGLFNDEMLSCGDTEWGIRAGHAGIATSYAAQATVFTAPRRSLKAAIVQARRIAAGRKSLRKLQAVANYRVNDEAIKDRRTTVSKIDVIMSATSFSIVQRLKVLFVAMVIRFFSEMERVRLALGFFPERR